MKQTYTSILLQVILGILVADIFTATGHWIEDSYLDYCVDIPILSDIAKDNELHHYFPRSILTYSYLEHMTYALPITLMVLCVLYIVNRSLFIKYPYFIFVFFITASSVNILHRFSHMRDCENNGLVRCLQKCGILCSHAHHSLHHKIADQKYCSISEYTNFVLDTLLVWRSLEHIVYLITGISPSRKTYMTYSSIQNHMHRHAKLECPDKPTPKDVEELQRILKDYKKCMLSNTLS